MSAKFEAGMWVYCPTFTGRLLYQLVDNSSDDHYPLRIDLGDDTQYTFRVDGKLSATHHHPSIFLATKENQEMLSKMYGVEFEAPPPTSFEIIQAIIKRDGVCWCAVSQKSEDCALQQTNLKLRKITSVFLDSAYPYEEKDGTLWSYAVPFAVTIKEITES